MDEEAQPSEGPRRGMGIDRKILAKELREKHPRAMAKLAGDPLPEDELEIDPPPRDIE